MQKLTDDVNDNILLALTSGNNLIELLCRQLTFAQGQDDDLLICTVRTIGNMASCSDDTIINALIQCEILSRLHGLLLDENE